MPALITEELFAELHRVRTHLVARDGKAAIAGLALPWAGDKLMAEGGLYCVGAATAGTFGACEPQTFDACGARSSNLCNRARRKCSPVFEVLDHLSHGLFGAGYKRFHARWGWSTLVKIGRTSGTPDRWPASHFNTQREVCARSLDSEFGHLRRSLIAIVTSDDFDMLGTVALRLQNSVEFAYDGIRFFWDGPHENLYVQGADPNAALAQGFGSGQLQRTVSLARQYLDWPR